MKKVMVMILVVTMLMTGCGAKPQGNENKKVITIGISQLIEHVALDSAKQGFIDEINKQGLGIVLEEKNAQGEPTNAQLIAEKFVSDKIDMIFTIATMTTQAAKKATDGTDIPVLFTAVTDPVKSQIVNNPLVPEGNISGVVDAVSKENQKDIFNMIKDLKSETSKVAIIFNTGESNSEIQVKEAKTIAAEMGIEIVPVGIANINDVTQAVNTASKKADALLLITDNMLASSIPLVAKLAIENNLITASVDFSHVQDGILIAKGVSYYELGVQAATMAKKVLIDGVKIKDLPIENSINLVKKYNVKTMEALKLDSNNKAFQDGEAI